MADILLYIRPEQVDRVFIERDVGSGQTTFGGMTREGGRVFVASNTDRGPAVVGEIPIDEAYEASDHPEGWKFRVRATVRSPQRYTAPVVLEEVAARLEFLQGAENIGAAIHYCRRLSAEDASLLTKLGGSGVVRRKVLLDEGLHGMAEFLRDDGWETVLLAKASKDDAVLDRAKAEGHIVVTGDEKLLDRCRRKRVEVIDVGFKGQLGIVEAHLRDKDSSTP